MSLMLILLGSYLIGSVSPSIILSKAVKGVDIRTHGSGNAGMTNAIRLLGAKWGAVVAIIDLLKGFLSSMVVVSWIGSWMGLGPFDETLVRILAGLAAVAGHIWTVFFGFRGGKGVLTVAGAVLGVAPMEVGICLVVFLLVFAITRIVSLGSIIGAGCFPIITFVERAFWKPDLSPYLLGFSILACGIILFTHRANIGRLLKGQEPAFGRKCQPTDDRPANPS